MILGAIYTSAAVVPDGSASPAVANPITDDVASARPGGRVSTIDLVGQGFALLAGSKGTGWAEAARLVQSSTGIAVSPMIVGSDGRRRLGPARWLRRPAERRCGERSSGHSDPRDRCHAGPRVMTATARCSCGEPPSML